MKEILYSVVVPLYNEADNIIPLVKEIEWVMKAQADSWELILVDDGSTDGTREIIAKITKEKPYIRPLKFKKNYGQTSALAAGVRAAKGSWIITLDGDGQNDPRDIPLLIDTCKQEFDLVSGRRQRRQDSWYKKIISKLANSIRKKVLHDKTEDTGCSLKLYRRKSLLEIPLYHGMHRFLPALFQIHGFRTTEVPVHHRKRERGKSKYNLFNRGISLFFDMCVVAWMRKRRLRYELESAEGEE